MSNEALSKIKRSSQTIDNLSFDEEYLQSAVLMLTENEAGTALGRQKQIATEAKQDITAAYSISDMDETGTTKYYGFLKSDGAWYIMSLTGTKARYIAGGSGYDFSTRAGLAYVAFNNAF